MTQTAVKPWRPAPLQALCEGVVLMVSVGSLPACHWGRRGDPLGPTAGASAGPANSGLPQSPAYLLWASADAAALQSTWLSQKQTPGVLHIFGVLTIPSTSLVDLAAAAVLTQHKAQHSPLEG